MLIGLAHAFRLLLAPSRAPLRNRSSKRAQLKHGFSSNGGHVGLATIRYADPASASPNRINACFAVRAFAGVRTVCRQSRSKFSRNEVGKVPARLASARRTSLTDTNTHVGDETQPQGEAAQRSGNNDADQLLPIRLIASAREHDCSGYWHSVAVPIL
jgi:hypothetical protein